jgi:hypothetical protein
MRPPVLLLALLAACDVGQVSGPPPSGPDAPASAIDAPAGGPDAAPAAGGPDAAPSACRNAVQTADSGHHNAGANCIVSGCHGGGGGGPVWTVAGTLYASAAGGTAVTGATITVIDANGATHDLVTALDGNFYTGAAILLPAKVFASSCPSIANMNATVAVGSCNSCHAGGNATGAIHLP